MTRLKIAPALAATALLTSAGGVLAHPGDHSALAFGELSGHVVSSPVHLPVMLASAAALAAFAAWRLGARARRVRFRQMALDKTRTK